MRPSALMARRINRSSISAAFLNGVQNSDRLTHPAVGVIKILTMSWKPIQPRNTGPSPLVRELISRGTLLVLTLLLAYGSYRCLKWVAAARAEAVALRAATTAQNGYARRDRTLSGTALPMTIGLGLGALALATGAGAVLPSKFFERFVHPPRDVDDDLDMVHRVTRIGRWS